MSFTLATSTLVHPAISLVGIGSGFVVARGLLAGDSLDRWTMTFLATTVATSVTGFGFPSEHLLPSHIVGAISLVVLTLAIYARYGRQLAGPWRRVYAIGAITALYLNTFVPVVQSFLKVPALHVLAPTQSEPPFLFTQLAVLAAFAVLGTFAAIRLRAQAPDFVAT